MKSKLIVIARHLSDQHESKKYGGYEVFEDDKIKIMYDTYYPNVCVNVKIDGKSEFAAIYSGHGHCQEFHGGAWEEYVTKNLYPKALERRVEKEKEKLNMDRLELSKKNARLNDSAVFG